MTGIVQSRREDTAATIATHIGGVEGVNVVRADLASRPDRTNYVIVVLDFEVCGPKAYEILHNLHVGLGSGRSAVRLVARLVWEEQAARSLALRMGADAITYGPVDVASVVELLRTDGDCGVAA